MKKTLMIASGLVLVASLAACKKAEQPAAAMAATADQAMGKMAPSTEAKTGTGEGKVISVNAATGAISIQHGPIKQLGWPGMTMGFTAKPDLLKGIAVGDKVAFEIKGMGENYEVTSIHKE